LAADVFKGTARQPSPCRILFDHLLDDAFQIDIKKSQIILNEALYDHILDFLTLSRRAAEEVYRKGRKAKTTESPRQLMTVPIETSAPRKEISKPAIQAIDPSTNEANWSTPKASSVEAEDHECGETA
jgi:hypothetical protein